MCGRASPPASTGGRHPALLSIDVCVRHPCRRAFRHLTLDDPRLSRASIGVQMVGNDAINTPPAHAIASRGIIDNVRGYMVYGDYRKPHPAAAIVEAVEGKQIDVGLVWGPLAGYFAGHSRVPLQLRQSPRQMIPAGQ